ncbi:MAG: sulfatase-like hydrolase/transferase, partial [Planctomycetota bacterium]
MPRQFVVIMTDTQRWDMVGCYGNADMKTPSLDRLAAGGVRFDRAYTTQPVCGPARAGLFTGLWPHSCGGWANSMALGDNVKTVGQRMRDNGFRCAHVGKWHLDGGDYFGLGRAPDGWDPEYWYDMRNYLEELTPEERAASRRTSMNRDPGVRPEFTFGHRVSDRAVRFLERHADEDFLLVVSYDEPHGPFLCPEPYASMYSDYSFPKSPNVWDDLADKPPHIRAWAGTALERDKDALEIRIPDYLGCNSFVDSEIGRVIEAVDSRAPGALVVYTSDHGDMMHSHSIGNKGPAVFDEITRVPLIVRWPDRAPAGSVCPHPVSHIDVVPTLMEAAGLDVPKSLEGASMLGTFTDPSARPRDEVFIEFGRYEVDHDGFGGFQPLRCVFDGRWKLAVNLLSTDELYDLETDPHEMKNLITLPDHAGVRDR